MLTGADRTYIAANYATLEELCADRADMPAEVEDMIEERRLPRPSYVLQDGTGMFPTDYFRLVDEAGGVEALEGHFAGRHRQATFARSLSHLSITTRTRLHPPPRVRRPCQAACAWMGLALAIADPFW